MSTYFMDSAALIESVKRRASIPDSQALISDEQILDYANEEMFLNLIPIILSKHEDYYVIREDRALVSNVTKYEMPYRAIGSKLREVAYADSNGDLDEMHRISIDELTSGHVNDSFSHNYYIENENIVLVGKPESIPTGFLVFFYHLRPNNLVDSDRIAIISAINTITGVITLESMPENFTAALKYDFIRTKSPHRILTFDIATSNLDSVGVTLTFNPDELPDKLEVGDRIAPQNETDLINAPSDLHVWLAQSVAARVLEAIGDLNNLSVANVKLAKMEANTGLLIENRITGSPLKAKVRHSFLRNRGRRSIRMLRD